MNHDTRLREDVAPRGDPQRPVEAGGDAPGANDHPLPVASAVYAALDLGTNNCRLLIACPFQDSFRVVDSFSRIIRLGEGISTTGCISEAATERAVAALSICRDKIQSKKARRLRLIATEACRAASNAERFRDRVASETGIQLEVIDRETEAALAVLGCWSTREVAAPSCSISAAVRPNWSGSSGIPMPGVRSRAPRPGCRSRSASSRWPSALAAGT
jgi:exopolyphosphatase/guanosine-5'-triphosphate,3'-diphosphate pyrophosphatase